MGQWRKCQRTHRIRPNAARTNPVPTHTVSDALSSDATIPVGDVRGYEGSERGPHQAGSHQYGV
ncbi:hypothetical protein SAMN05216605_102652 [Pseudomonas abietaniphila]|uniref:Uncharacterized protein n=1 Tax=Pseudomonas abietaniphila TaxID=89065 RepID=A0A1G7VW85_9PSED|nr:hypothetical protein SAMN05216605_102652 [Pseudomonas abietaniphila]